jgi:hypothetical protein
MASEASQVCVVVTSVLRLCALCVPVFQALTPPPTAQLGAHWTLWLRLKDVAGARTSQYDDIEDVDPQQLVSKFKKRLLIDKKLAVEPSLVTVRLVPCGARTPSAEEEAAAIELDPRLTLASAGVCDGGSLLLYFPGECET